MTAADPTAESAIPASTAEPGAAPRRVLIILLGAIGDVVRALPLLGRIRRAWPAAHIAWAVEPKSQAVLEGHPWLDELIVYDRRRAPFSFLPFLCPGARGPFRPHARPPAPSEERGGFDRFRSPRARRLSIAPTARNSTICSPPGKSRRSRNDAPEADAVPGLRRRARALPPAPMEFGLAASAVERARARAMLEGAPRPLLARHPGFVMAEPRLFSRLDRRGDS